MARYPHLLLLAGMVAGAACSAQPVLYDDFENDLSTRWKGIGAFWKTSTAAVSGKQAIQRVVYAGGKPGDLMIQANQVYPVPQEKSGFSIQVGGSDNDNITQILALELYDANGKRLAAPDHLREYPLSAVMGPYTKNQQMISFPEKAAKFRPVLKIRVNKTPTKTHYVRFEDLTIAPWSDLMPNGNVLDMDFENAGYGWQIDGKKWRISSGAKSGTSSLVYVSDTNSPTILSEDLQAKQLVPVQGGETYRLCGYITGTEKTHSTRLSLEVTFLDADGNELFYGNTRPAIPAPARWMEVSSLVTAPAIAVSARIGVRVASTKPIKGVFHCRFDAIRLPVWSVEKKRVLPKGTPPPPTKLEDPDSGKVTSGEIGIGKFYQADRDPSPEYADVYPNQWTLGSKLTDGKSDKKTFNRDNFVGWRKLDPLSITVDMGRPQTLETVSVSGYREYEAHYGEPESFSVAISSDRETWTDWGSWKREKKSVDGSYLCTTTAPAQKGRYVRITIKPDQEKGHGVLMLDEITLSGKIKNTWKHVPANGAYHAAFPPTYGFKQPLRSEAKSGIAHMVYEKVVGKKLAMVLWYQGMSPERPFSELQELRLNDLMENNYGQRFMCFGWLPGAGALDRIIAGEMDEYFTEYFTDSIDEVKTYGDKTPLWFRPLNEFNSNWVTWGLQPEKFRLAWRRMYNIAEQIGAAERHIFVWAPNHRSYPDVEWNKMEHYYPGDQYVDWVGLSCYPPSRQYVDSEDARYPIGRCKEVNSKFGDRKPMMIAEGGFDSPDKMDQVRWVKEWFEFDKVYPSFKAMIWENHFTRVIQDAPAALELYRKVVQNPYWISESYTGN